MHNNIYSEVALRYELQRKPFKHDDYYRFMKTMMKEIVTKHHDTKNNDKRSDNH